MNSKDIKGAVALAVWIAGMGLAQAPAPAAPASPPVAPAPATGGAAAPGQTPTAPAQAAAPALAAPTIPQPPGPSPDSWAQSGNAVLVLMNKVDSHPRQVTVPVGGSITYGSLTITVRSCLSRPGDQIEDWAAYLDIVDSHTDEPGFQGWMLAKEPWLGMLQHPVYDVRLTDCQ